MSDDEIKKLYRKLKIGDIVIITAQSDGLEFDNQKAKVLFENNDCWCFEFEKNIGGHNCSGRGKHGYCWYVGYQNIRRLTVYDKNPPDITRFIL